MEHTKPSDRHAQILDVLSHLPKKMVSLQGDDKVAAFVLYELCQKHCFDLERAAYFVDNPDFNCLKGVAGCARPELVCTEDIWQATDTFSNTLTKSPFHGSVSELAHPSLKHGSRSEKEAIAEIADRLGLKNPSHCCWKMKHDNHGLLIFEKSLYDDTILDEHLVDGLSLLSFCPIT
ncbi:hypothetical protein CVU75_01500 [Candidatus Dependentiae bacterium HGW-Dependentiae-1]|nr:MAG: hypothetical protein CVU75_01500 [Candidatus Dependentiae bacterium HGW-Dependentiae-1]